MTTPTREAFLRAAESAVALLRDPAVPQAWSKPSALPGMTVGGLAVHLARQVTRVAELAAVPAPDEPPCPLLEHYARSAWVGASAEDEVNVQIARKVEQAAAGGAGEPVAAAATALRQLRTVLPAEPAGRVVNPPWTEWTLRLDDFLVTRMLEIAVHSDDLAVSLGIPTPVLPPAVLDPVLDLLTRLAARRHGPTAVLRALSRAERAPATIAAL